MKHEKNDEVSMDSIFRIQHSDACVENENMLIDEMLLK